GLARRGGPVQTGPLEHPDFAARDSAGVRVQRRGRVVLRHLAGAPGGEPRSDRLTALRIVGDSTVGSGEQGAVPDGSSATWRRGGGREPESTAPRSPLLFFPN